MIAIVGSSGAGKTTLLNFLTGRQNLNPELDWNGELIIN